MVDHVARWLEVRWWWLPMAEKWQQVPPKCVVLLDNRGRTGDELGCGGASGREGGTNGYPGADGGRKCDQCLF